jgi:pimeloyl-ACP methyl ester carboxylesterase
MKSTLISIALIYTLCCLMLFVLQRKFLYMPPSAISIPAGVEPGVVDIGFDADGARLQGWLLNGGQTKALLYYGGNAESVEYNLDQFRSLLPDYSVYLIPYRGYGPSSGSPSEKKLYTDALQVYDAVQGQYAEVALMGRSLGSGVATFVASRREVTRLVLVTPYDVLRIWPSLFIGCFRSVGCCGISIDLWSVSLTSVPALPSFMPSAMR